MNAIAAVRAYRAALAWDWLDRTEQFGAVEDADAEFVFLWIAFNAAYATEIDTGRCGLRTVASMRYKRSKNMQVGSMSYVANTASRAGSRSRVLLRRAVRGA